MFYFFSFQIRAFTENPGPNLPEDFDTTTASPLDYFWLLFPMNLLVQIVEHTNAYAAWKMRQPAQGPDDSWHDVTLSEMRAFMAVNILMGICQLPSLDYTGRLTSSLGTLEWLAP